MSMQSSPCARRPLILVADDDTNIRDLFEVLLTGAGYDVVTVADGPSAVHVAHEHDVDLLVLDLRMPGLQGTDVCRAYHERGGRAPVILVTAGPTWVAEARAAGAVDIIAKPFDIDRVLAAVSYHLRAWNDLGPKGVTEPVERRDCTGESSPL